MSAVASLPNWDLTPYFPSLESPEFAQALQQFRTDLSNLESLFSSNNIDRTDAPPAEIIAPFEKVVLALNQITDDIRLIYAYVNAHVDTDSRDEKAQAQMSELELDMVRLAQLRTRFAAWIGSIDALSLLASSELARSHEYALRKTIVAASKQMSPEEENLAADLSITGSNAWAKLHGNLTSQIEVSVNLPSGMKTMPISAARNLAYDADSAVREVAYYAELDAWKANETVIAACMNGVKGETLTLSNRRNWASPLDSALFSANIDRETLDAMMESAREFFPAFHRYLKAKARLVHGKDKLPFWSLFAPVGGSETPWNYDRGMSFVVETFGKFSPKMADFAQRSFDENWIDVESRPGKRDGAYCMGTKDGKSLILMNFKPAFGSVSTLAHELGHAYHNLCLKERTALQRNTPMTLAETASIFCETICRHEGLKHGTDAEKLNILEAAICGYCQVVVDITSRYQFESNAFAQRAKRELSANEYCEIMLQAQRDTYGAGMDESQMHPYMWAAKPHYYSSRSFYNFPYMFGLLFGLGLYSRYQENPGAFLDQYDDLLSSTGLADAASLSAPFGIDLRDKAFWKGSLSVIEGEINQFEALCP